MLKADFKDLKAKFDCIAFIKQNLSYKDYGKYIYAVCPFHDDKNPSLEVHYSYAKCKAGCLSTKGYKSFDCVDLVAKIMNMDEGAAIEYIKNQIAAPTFSSSIRLPKAPSFEWTIDIALQLWDIAKCNKDKAYDYLFNQRNITKPAQLPENIGFITKDSLENYNQFPFFIRNRNFFIAPGYDDDYNINALYLRHTDDSSAIKHLNALTPRLWLPCINGVITPINKDTWFAESVTDTFLTMHNDNNYNVAAVFSCYNYPCNSKLIVDCDNSSIAAARAKNAITMRIGNNKDHAISLHYTDINTLSFDIPKMLIAIVFNTNDIYVLMFLLPYIFVLANASYEVYCAAYTLRNINGVDFKDLVQTMEYMANSKIHKKKKKQIEEDSFFDNSIDPNALLINTYKMKETLDELYAIYLSNEELVLDKISAFVESEKTNTVFNKKLIVQNSINFNIKSSSYTQKPQGNLDIGLEYCKQGDVHVLGGRSGGGKTSIACAAGAKLLRNDENAKIAYLSFELSIAEIEEKIGDYDKDRLTIFEISDFGLVQKMKIYIHFVINRLAIQGYNAFFIDHIGFLADSNGDWLETVMQQIKTICSIRGITVICLSQLLKNVDLNGYYAAQGDLYGGSWLLTIPSAIYLIQEFMRDIDKKNVYHKNWHIAQPKHRHKPKNAPIPVPIDAYDYLNNEIIIY